MLEKDLPNRIDAIFQAEKPNNNSEIHAIREEPLTSKKPSKLRKRSVESEKPIPRYKNKKQKMQKSTEDSIWPREASLHETLPTPTEEASLHASSPSEATRDKSNKPTTIDNWLVWVMAITCGLTAANLYYMQPLLAAMGRNFAVSINQIGLTATLGQLGFACGLILIVPLGDKYNQRTLIVSMLCILAVALTAMACAWTIVLLSIASFAVGLTTIIPELIIPFAVSLAPSNERGRIAGLW